MRPRGVRALVGGGGARVAVDLLDGRPCGGCVRKAVGGVWAVREGAVDALEEEVADLLQSGAFELQLDGLRLISSFYPLYVCDFLVDFSDLENISLVKHLQSN